MTDMDEIRGLVGDYGAAEFRAGRFVESGSTTRSAACRDADDKRSALLQRVETLRAERDAALAPSPPETPATPHDLADAQADSDGWSDLAAKAAPETPAPRDDGPSFPGYCIVGEAPTRVRGKGWATAELNSGWVPVGVPADRDPRGNASGADDMGRFCLFLDVGAVELREGDRVIVLRPAPPETPAPSPVESPGEERPRADLAEIERLVSKYGRAIVYGGNGLKALEARATLLSAIRSLRAPREVEEVVRAARQVIDANWIAHSPGTVGERLANALSRLSSSSGESPERGDGERRCTCRMPVNLTPPIRFALPDPRCPVHARPSPRGTGTEGGK